MGQSSGMALVAALILAASVVAASLIMKSSLDATTAEIAQLREGIAELELAAPAPSQPSQQARRPGRPDPSKRYTVNTTGSPAKGPEGALEIVEFSDFQCPFCGRVTPTLQQVQREYGDKVRIVFKHLPLSIHPKAPGAHAASEAAHKQGKFWEMHDLIFANQREMSEEKYIEFAGQLDLDVEQFKADSASAAVKQRLASDTAEASKLGVTGTPAFFINGRFLSGAQPYESFKRLIDEEMKADG